MVCEELCRAISWKRAECITDLIKQEELNVLVESKRRLNLLQYRLSDDQVFDELLSLFKKTNSDVRQRA